jgi:EAL domain-containing protein (putative c-di-GMP-specific phosphodiesterase class I)/GGDEF domain-containing protein
MVSGSLMRIPTYREVESGVGTILREQNGIGAILIDLSSLARIERSFGAKAYQALQTQIEHVLGEVRDKVREGDILVRDPDGDRFILFLSRRRDGKNALSVENLQKFAQRLEEQIRPRVSRLSLPYLRERPSVDVGYGFVIHSPLESDDRQIQRVIEECRGSADLRRLIRERDEHEGLIEIIHNRQLWTAFQPIVELETRRIVGHEGLSRGPRASELETPYALFGAAGRQGITEELERACRRQAFVDWEVFGASGRLFINTVPATVRDTSFLGRGVLDYLGPRLSPRDVTLEITEQRVIENLNLYREAMHSFMDLGFSFAIDDVGAGYSGLETMATLGAAYLKIDMVLVRDVHHKRVSQQIVKAILDMGAGVDAKVIAEGIETQEEAEALKGLGVLWGQGYLFGRPQDPYVPGFRPGVRTTA